MEKEFVNSMEKETQAVKVAVHIRPLIANEKIQDCKECITIKAGEPQVQMGNIGFTFDHVYGNNATPSSRIFEECVLPLVDGMFHGYNATVLAYGQTGSGKTYTMGTAYTVGDNTDGIIPRVMDLIFKRVENSPEKVEYQVRVSFIEILNEEVHDLLDTNSPTSIPPDLNNGFCTRSATHPKQMLQIRETINGEITLSGVTDCEVHSLQEMATLLEQGSLSRATASTNMNSQSSRSHAILTITLRQKRKFELHAGCAPFLDHFRDDCLCAKLHLVDLAGSERVKRTGADGVRFKEGVHINKGLLSLGNVISALGDEKKRKEGGHVPYRDSKLTRLLQDSLGGNSRTVMIACISPADCNAEETLNTLKYANRARNIENKPVVNRDPMAAEVQRMREQLELLQAELLCNNARGRCLEDTDLLKQKIAWLESSNAELHQELQRAHESLQFCAHRILDAMTERDDLRHKLELLRSGRSWDEVDSIDGYQTSFSDDSLGLLEAYTNKVEDLDSEKTTPGAHSLSFPQPFASYKNVPLACNEVYMDLHEAHRGDSGERICTTAEDDEADARELEHSRLQVSMGTELKELNERLKQKEEEMSIIFTSDNMILKQQFEKKLLELEEEKKTLQRERDRLLMEIKKLACVPYVQNKKMQDVYSDKLNDLELQLTELKQKEDNETQILKQKFRGDDAAKHLHEEIQRMKSQKVQLQHKIKQEAEHFRCWKASREKELLQLRKEGRKNEHEMLKLQALNQRQKMVLQRKTEEAALATRRLKDLLEARKSCNKENTNTGSNMTNGSMKRGHANLKVLLQAIDQELELAVHIREVRKNYENQTELRDCLARELEKLLVLENAQDMLETTRDSLAFNSFTSPDARQARAELLKNILDSSTHTLVAMASQLSEAEERERAFTGRGRWEQLRTMGDAKGVLHYVFNIAIDARCQLWGKAMENKELKENIEKLTKALKQSEAFRIEAYRQQYLARKMITNAEISSQPGVHDISMNLSHVQGISRSEYGFKKVMHRRSRKECHSKVGKLVRWRRSHERWFLQFKGRWQKPWNLSEWIRQGDAILTRASSSRITSLKLIK